MIDWKTWNSPVAHEMLNNSGEETFLEFGGMCFQTLYRIAWCQANNLTLNNHEETDYQGEG